LSGRYHFEIFAADGSAVTSVAGDAGDDLDAVSCAYDILEVWPIVEVWHERGLVLRLSTPAVSR
jgi:hypothetical protein